MPLRAIHVAEASSLVFLADSSDRMPAGIRKGKHLETAAAV